MPDSFWKGEQLMAGQKEHVNELLVQSFKELACSRPIEKITIREITDRAGVIRPTFYNHFQDKYELLEQIIVREVLEPTGPLIQAGMIDEAMLLMLAAVERDKEFYIRASRLEGQNSFEEIVRACIRRVLLGLIQEHAVFQTPKNRWQTPENVSEYYAQSMCYIVMTWIRSNMAVPPKEVVEIYNYIITHSMKDVLEGR